ncbi:MAG: carboxylating nicotinate-nucleotide diphosphorylase [Spirochaetales bacterium]|nr:MAG: carboxylating nicotinate-nucleotide diphosphorylase [Spirochaetales bacterium]
MKLDPVETLIDLALDEDLSGLGDVTSEAVFTGERAAAVLRSKDSGIVAGSGVFTRVFERIDREVSVRFLVSDGDRLSPGDIAAELEGPLVSILKAERIALNFICYLSGIATAARGFMEAARASGGAVILDTRKTLPGYRGLAKAAVLAGGAGNHRMGLYDMVMIKDNHVDGAGSITAAVERVRSRWGSRFRIEVECRTFEEVREALSSSVDVIMLDNMTPEEVKASLTLRPKDTDVCFEVSGNMDLEKIKKYSMAGVDFISLGKLTHSVKAFDFSLKIRKDSAKG